jgi:hypothetical protein
VRTYALLGGPNDVTPNNPGVTNVLTSSTWNVIQNQRYRAVFHLSMLDATDALARLQDMGFSEVKPYQSGELPADWPLDYDNPQQDSQGNSVMSVTVRVELLWAGKPQALVRTLQLATAPATVLKAWEYNGADTSTPTVPDPNAPSTPAVPGSPAVASPSSVSLGTVVGVSAIALAAAGVAALVWRNWR